jgi:diguanylate cyclase (GGDEF)-like protein
MAASAPIRGRSKTGTVRADGLTGLICGGAFESRVSEMIQRDSDGSCSILVFGLDRFRHVNDLLGYEAGDFALREMSVRLKSCLPEDAVVGRLGGDEFGVLLEHCCEQEVLLHAARALDLIRQPVKVSGRELFLSVSAGLSLHPKDGTTAAQLLRRASRAMARAKERGGNALDRSMSGKGLRPEARYQMERGLRAALLGHQFTLRYQPQVDRDGRMRCMEALLVWNHPELGHVETETFIRLAEETGAIFPIGDWVLRESCRQIAEWRRAKIETVRVAVNVSPVQFSSPDFVDTVRRILVEHDLSGDALELEITEGTILRDVDESASRMLELRQMGVRIAIDDFGVGYSPLSYLNKLPLDVVKVDRTFVSELTKPSGSLPLVHTITVLAHHRGLEVVAEGVETEGELEMVCAARCDLVQGYLISTPVGSDEMARMMTSPEILRAAFGAPQCRY